MRLPTPAPLRDAEADLVWVIVPFSRPENIERVLANFTRQKFPFKRLVLVLNGRARCTFDGFDTIRLARHASVLMSSDAHQSIAKNSALAEIRRRGGGFTVTMDDDDWYGPNYLTEAAGYARSYDLIGKGRHFVSVDGGLWLCSRETRLQKGSWLTGGTIACWAESAPEYPTHIKHGEDVVFTERAIQQGMSVFRTDIYNYVYRRESKVTHAWSMSHEDLRAYEAERGAWDLGAFSTDAANGTVLDVSGHVLALREDAETLAPPPPGVTQHVSP